MHTKYRLNKILASFFLVYSVLYATQSNTINYDCLPLLDSIQTAVEFEKERPSLFLTNDIYEQEVVKKQYEDLDELMDDLYNKVASLVVGKQSKEDFFYDLLQLRIDILRDHEVQILAFENNRHFIPPTDNELFNYFAKELSFMGGMYKKFNSIRKNNGIRRWKMIAFLTKEIFNILRDHNITLSDKTINLLRACKGIYPILAGTSKDSGFADKYGGYLVIKKIIMMLAKLDEEPLPYSNLDLAMKIVKAPKDVKGNWTQLLDNVELTGLEKKKIALTLSLIKKGTYIKLAFPDADAYIYEGHFIKKKRYFRYDGISMLHEGPIQEEQAYDLSNNKLFVEMTDYEYWQTYKKEANHPCIFDLQHPDHHTTIWPYPLPSIDHLFHKAKQEVSLKSYYHPIPNQCWTKNYHSQGLQSSYNQIPTKHNPINSTKVTPTVQEKNRLLKKKTAKQTILPSTKKIIQRKHTIIQNKASFYNRMLPQVEVVFKGYGTYPMPRGTRSYFAYIKNNPCEIKKLSSKHQNTVDALFNPQTAGNITYDTYKKAMHYVGCEIEEGHGSHKRIKDSRGKIIGGIFAHNKNQTYGTSCMKYLCFYMLCVGIRPSYKA